MYLASEDAVKMVRDAEPGAIDLNSTEGNDIDRALSGDIVALARLMDRLHGINPLYHKGDRPMYGTPNQKSYTYKVRKALGYTYP